VSSAHDPATAGGTLGADEAVILRPAG
jgi:hypothetical protein